MYGFKLIIVYCDGQSKTQRYSRGPDAARSLGFCRDQPDVAYAQLNGPDGLAGRYVAEAAPLSGAPSGWEVLRGERRGPDCPWATTAMEEGAT